MKVTKVDLYNYFNVERPQGASGYLNCYLLNDGEALDCKRPAMLVIPGGGYHHVSLREKEPIALEYFNANYITFTLEYSVAPIKFPYAFMEASMAMCYIRENANQLNVDKNKVCGIGFSAGGHLLGCISTMYNREELNFLKEKRCYVKPDASIFMYSVINGLDKPHMHSFVNLFGENYEGKLKEFSINENVDKNSPPAFIVSTVGDNCVPCKNSLHLALAYENSGVPFTLHIFEKGNHGLSLLNEKVYAKAELNEVLKITSNDYSKWLEMSLTWLKELGF